MATSQAQKSGSNRNRRRSGGRNRNRSSRNSNSGNNRSRSSNRSYTRENINHQNRVPRDRHERAALAEAGRVSFAQKLLSILTLGFAGGKTVGELHNPAATPAAQSEGRQRGDRQQQRERPGRKGGAEDKRGGKSERRPKAGPAREKRTPEVVEVTNERLYVGNLSYDAAENDLTELFGGVGTVANAEVVSHRNSQRSKGYAFVTMGTTDEARRAVEVLHDKDFMGRQLVVSGAKSQGVRDSSGNASRTDSAEIPSDSAEIPSDTES
ncbi:MAG: RNA recognition motif domain-containing protein [Verrucomicrobiales bacterium]